MGRPAASCPSWSLRCSWTASTTSTAPWRSRRRSGRRPSSTWPTRRWAQGSLSRRSCVPCHHGARLHPSQPAHAHVRRLLKEWQQCSRRRADAAAAAAGDVRGHPAQAQHGHARRRLQQEGIPPRWWPTTPSSCSSAASPRGARCVAGAQPCPRQQQAPCCSARPAQLERDACRQVRPQAGWELPVDARAAEACGQAGVQTRLAEPRACGAQASCS